MSVPAPAAARAAATVVVLREGAGAAEVLLLRRHAGSGFAAASWVFPGGVVDPADALLPGSYRGLDPAAAAPRFAATPDETLAFHVAAVRETFEEAGLLFARDASGARVRPDVARRLRAGAAGDLPGDRFAAMLAGGGLVADLGALTYLSRWVTPVVEPRRYDTCFFLARAPEGQVADPDRVETTERRWCAPAEALAEHRAGRLRMMFPTVRSAARAGRGRRCRRPDLRGGGTADGPQRPAHGGARRRRAGRRAPAPRRARGRAGAGVTLRRLDELTEVVLAPNPSPLTLDGTNTYLLGAPGEGAVVVVDPGPDLAAHRDAVDAALAARDAEVVAVVVTHHHADHAEAVAWSSDWGAEVFAFTPALVDAPAAPLLDGQRLSRAGIVLEAVATPGHASDHLCLRVVPTDVVLSGDHVLGRGTTVVAWPDGNMADYLDSLRRVRDLAPSALYPGHGPVVDDPQGTLDAYLAHRHDREREVLAALAAGDATPAEVVARVYADVDPVLHPAAERTVRAHLDKLRAEGRVHRTASPGGSAGDAGFCVPHPG